MKRVAVSHGQAHEWIAPENIRQAVRRDYLLAMDWLPLSQTLSWTQQWNEAPRHFSGLYLRRHQEILKQYRVGRMPPYLGVLQCRHSPTVRHFSDDGLRCLVVDRQHERIIQTYNINTHRQVSTQVLEDASFVFEMAYDRHMRHWKVDRLIQQLPVGWQSAAASARPQRIKTLPSIIGRDF